MSEEARAHGLSKRQLGVTFHNRPVDVLHNHKPDDINDPLYAPTRVEYGGFSTIAPHYHVFRCVAEPQGGTAVVENKDLARFCTFRRHCKDDEPAHWVTKDGRYAFCDRHAMNYNRGPCPWSSIDFCRVSADLSLPGVPPERCAICEKFEGRASWPLPVYSKC